MTNEPTKREQIRASLTTPEGIAAFEKGMAMKSAFKGIYATPPHGSRAVRKSDPNNPKGARKPRRRK